MKEETGDIITNEERIMGTVFQRIIRRNEYKQDKDKRFIMKVKSRAEITRLKVGWDR